MSASVEIRRALIDALRLDLVDPDHCAEAESIVKRPTQYAKPVISSVPAHLQKIAERIRRRTVALDVEPASMLTLLESRARADELRGA